MNKPHRSNTLDRLQRFSFGGARSTSVETAGRKRDADGDGLQRRARASDSNKTERLRELTEKLKQSSPPLTATTSVDSAPGPEEVVRRPFPRSASFSPPDARRSSAQTDARLLTHPIGRRGVRHAAHQLKSAKKKPSPQTSPHKVPSSEASSLSGPATEAPTQRVTRNSSGERNVDKSRKRKGMYITKWPTMLGQHGELLAEGSPQETLRWPTEWPTVVDSEGCSESESETAKTDTNADLSSPPRRYSKRPLRGPYGQMLEAEMKKPETNRMLSKLYASKELKFLDELVGSGGNNKQCPVGVVVQDSSQIMRSVDDSDLQLSTTPLVRHQRTTSSPSQLEQCPSTHSQDCLVRPPLANATDTRTHIVVELYESEKYYVESLQTLVCKYLQPLKNPENVALLEPSLVDNIFYQIPSLLLHHETFLEDLRKRLEEWDVKQKIGDIFIDIFTKPSVIETYTTFVNNWNKAKELIKCTSQSKPAFAKFLESTAREHKGKLALDSLLIKPIQKFPKYEMLIQRLLKHTELSHPDHQLLTEAQHHIHDLLIRINCTERETSEVEQQQQNLKDLECLVEGLMNLVVSDRQYLRHDLVTMVTSHGVRKERALFLFSDILLITSIKRRSGTIRKPSSICPVSVANALETHKYKLIMRIPLDDLEIIKTKEGNFGKELDEFWNITEDVTTLSQINDLIWSLHCPHEQLEEVVQDMLTSLNRQLSDRQTIESPESYLELGFNTSNGNEVISILFSKTETRTSWEETFNEAKQKLAQSPDRRPSPEFVSAVPIRKTRSGLQFTCAAPTLAPTADVWVCNSDGYVGQVCVLNLQPEPTVISCNSVCNARILCMASIPADSVRNSANNSIGKTRDFGSLASDNTIIMESASSSDAEDNYERHSGSDLLNQDNISECLSQPSMWLGTEDGCIHMYNCCDNIRIKKNRFKIQHNLPVKYILYLDNHVYVSLSNGDVIVYARENNSWNFNSPNVILVGTSSSPVIRMLPNAGKIWCSCSNVIKILNASTLQIEHTFSLSNDNKHFSCMAVSGSGVWIAMQNSAIIKCVHVNTYDIVCEVNVTPAVNKILSGCDDIIRQHKAACLRVTALQACKDLLWIGTSAGVVLTLHLPHISSSTEKIVSQLSVTGLPHGHTGQVRFLTYVEDNGKSQRCSHHRYSGQMSKYSGRILVISGGDGYEDFRNSNVSELAGREDSTNHLLLWHL